MQSWWCRYQTSQQKYTLNKCFELLLISTHLRNTSLIFNAFLDALSVKKSVLTKDNTVKTLNSFISALCVTKDVKCWKMLQRRCWLRRWLHSYFRVYLYYTWWRHQMETFPALLAIGAGNSPVLGEFPAQRPVTRSFYVFFDLRLNKRLSKRSRGW